MNKLTSVVGVVWKYGRWILLAAALAFTLLFALGVWTQKQQHKYAIQLKEKMQTDRITLADVMGENLPPMPDSAENDKTLYGIDANRNGIRDDVELSIFRLHPDSARIRAAQLQYAKYLQYTLDPKVMTSEVEQTVSYSMMPSAVECMVGLSISLGRTTAEQVRTDDMLHKEIQALVVNTEERKKQYDTFNNYAEAGVIPDGHGCDIDLDSLPN